MGKWVSLGELGEKVAGDANGVAYGQREANDPYTHRTRTRTFPHAACNARAAITLHPRNHAVIASQPQISLTPHRCPPLPPRPPPSSDAPELASELVSELVVSELESSEEEDDEDEDDDDEDEDEVDVDVDGDAWGCAWAVRRARSASSLGSSA